MNLVLEKKERVTTGGKDIDEIREDTGSVRWTADGSRGSASIVGDLGSDVDRSASSTCMSTSNKGT